MLIDKKLISDLLEKASLSPRKRINFDLRDSEQENSQRMLNAMLPETKFHIHRHRESSETVVLICGSMSEVFYDDNGNVVARYDLSPATGNYGLQIPKGMWHTILVHEPTVIVESKDGAYSPLTDQDIMTI